MPGLLISSVSGRAAFVSKPASADIKMYLRIYGMIYLLLLIILLRSYVPSYVCICMVPSFLFIRTFVRSYLRIIFLFFIYYDYHIILCLPVMAMIMMIPFICDFNW